MAGKKKRAAAKEKRKKEKKAQKDAMRALYASYRDSKTNSKRHSRRVKKTKKKAHNMISHPDGECGNVGCRKCFPPNFNKFMKNGKPRGMPQWMYIEWSNKHGTLKNRTVAV